jgi:crotonobetainyl-CoA:carnitine CoA-transferase CaiB-like acyl-CoA transferase
MSAKGPLGGITVIDAATLFAGPLAAMLLGDFGADVIKVEHPRGDPARGHGYAKDGVGLWWKMLSRNKRAVTCNLSNVAGREVFLRLVRDADVLIENFRPGTFERWGLSPAELFALNPTLVLVRVTGFGQTGPMAREPGFGTIAESMSGFAHITGLPDGPPTLPPFGLADGIAGLATAFATLTALEGSRTLGRGQVVDMAIIEPILTLLGAQPTAFDLLGIVQEREGNRSINNAPRNTYRSRDGVWLSVSASSQNIAERVMRLVGRDDVIGEPWFATGRGRAAHANLLDDAVARWIGQRDAEEVVAAFRQAEAAITRINSIADVMSDPQYAALGSIASVEDSELGAIKMQNVIFRLSETPGSIRWTGPALGAHNEEVYSRLGIDEQELIQLAEDGAI